MTIIRDSRADPFPVFTTFLSDRYIYSFVFDIIAIRKSHAREINNTAHGGGWPLLSSFITWSPTHIPDAIIVAPFMFEVQGVVNHPI